MMCSIALCNSDNQSKMVHKNIMFFRFPNDPKMAKIWVGVCKRKDQFLPKNGRICSKHFTADSFTRDLQYELMGVSSKNRRSLKEDAVPTLHLPFSKPAKNNKKREERMRKRESKKCVQNLLDLATASDLASECHGKGTLVDIASEIHSRESRDIVEKDPENNLSQELSLVSVTQLSLVSVQ
uniref:THAP domain-containing protein 1-like n=1 Tax=Diabrotica virgifera virgifera TaxID=50390 RepID=A0A6P7FA01_DIAVI